MRVDLDVGEEKMNWEKLQEIILYVIIATALVGIAFMFTMIWIA
jgi:hypothetical protein